MIVYDPTEDRAGTRLPQAIRGAGRPMAGLEAMTAGDLLITTSDFYLPEVAENMPVPLVTAFKNAVMNGVLIQRKSGRDLVSSIPDLNKILVKMSECNPRPWLVSTGEIKDQGGYVVSEGMKTKVKYISLMAALTAWQRRGGYWLHLESDAHLVPWVKAWEERWLGEAESKMVMMTRQTEQSLMPAGWWERLTMIPGVGLKTAEAIAKWLPEGHKNAVTALSYLSNCSGNYRKNDHPVGVGPATFEAVRRWLMLKDGYQLTEEEIEKGS